MLFVCKKDGIKMQRRMMGPVYLWAFVTYDIVLVFANGILVYRNYNFFIHLHEVTVHKIFFELIPLIGIDIIFLFGIIFVIQNFLTLIGKIKIDEFGVQVVICSKRIFSAAWDELEDIGLSISNYYITVGSDRPVGRLFFSKKKMNLKSTRTGRELIYYFTNSHRAVIWDVATEILKPDLMKYIPTERLIWIRDKNFSKEKFYRLKYQTNWDSKE